MATSYVFPDNRAIFEIGAPGSAVFSRVGMQVKIFKDAACSQPADIALWPSGAPVVNSTVVVDGSSELPLFTEATGLKSLWALPIQANITVPTQIFPQVESRVEAMETTLAAIAAASGTPILTSYIHDQATASDTWLIVHNMGFHPNVAVVDSTGREIDGGDIVYLGSNSLQITFGAPFGGTAYLS